MAILIDKLRFLHTLIHIDSVNCEQYHWFMLSITGRNSYRWTRTIFCNVSLYTCMPDSFQAKCFPKWQIAFNYVLHHRRWVLWTIDSIGRISEKSFILNKKKFVWKGAYGSLADFLYKKLVGCTKVPLPITLKPDTDEKLTCTIWGPTCDALDQVFENILLPRLNIGDIIMFENMGAYTITLASEFNGFTVPRIEYYATHKDLYVHF